MEVRSPVILTFRRFLCRTENLAKFLLIARFLDLVLAAGMFCFISVGLKICIFSCFCSRRRKVFSDSSRFAAIVVS